MVVMLVIGVALLISPTLARRQNAVTSQLMSDEDTVVSRIASTTSNPSLTTSTNSEDLKCKGWRYYYNYAYCSTTTTTPTTSTTSPTGTSTAAETRGCDGDLVPRAFCEGGCDAFGKCWVYPTFGEMMIGVEAYQVPCQCEEGATSPTTKPTSTTTIPTTTSSSSTVTSTSTSTPASTSTSSSEVLACNGDWVPSSTCDDECDVSGMCWHKRTFADVTRGVEPYKVLCRCEESTASPTTTTTSSTTSSSSEAPACDGDFVPGKNCEGECDASGMCWHRRTFADVTRGVEPYKVLCRCEKSAASSTTSTTSSTTSSSTS